MRRDVGLRPVAELHTWLVEVLKAAVTYPLAYRAAFRWDAFARLSLVDCPVQAMAAADDPLSPGTRDAAALVVDQRFIALPRFDAPEFSARRRGAQWLTSESRPSPQPSDERWPLVGYRGWNRCGSPTIAYCRVHETSPQHHTFLPR